MAKAVYVGASDLARKVKKIYVGVGGKAKAVLRAYIGVNGIAKLCFGPPPGVEPSIKMEYVGKAPDSFIADGADGMMSYSASTSGALIYGGVGPSSVGMIVYKDKRITPVHITTPRSRCAVCRPYSSANLGAEATVCGGFTPNGASSKVERFNLDTGVSLGEFSLSHAAGLMGHQETEDAEIKFCSLLAGGAKKQVAGEPDWSSGTADVEVYEILNDSSVKQHWKSQLSRPQVEPAVLYDTSHINDDQRTYWHVFGGTEEPSDKVDSFTGGTVGGVHTVRVFQAKLAKARAATAANSSRGLIYEQDSTTAYYNGPETFGDLSKFVPIVLPDKPGKEAVPLGIGHIKYTESGLLYYNKQREETMCVRVDTDTGVTTLHSFKPQITEPVEHRIATAAAAHSNLFGKLVVVDGDDVYIRG